MPVYYHQMTRQAPSTTVTTVRIFRAQLDALKTDFPHLSTSALVRVLFTLFLDSKIPEAYPLALEEMDRAEQALKSNVSPKSLVP